MNYSKYLADGGVALLPQRRSKRRDGSMIHMCPTCTKYRAGVRIIDTTLWPNAPADWACDGCWTDWRRHHTEMQLGDDPLCEAEWEHMSFGLLGADVAHHIPIIKRQLAKEIHHGPRRGKTQAELAKLNTRLNSYAD